MSSMGKLNGTLDQEYLLRLFTEMQPPSNKTPLPDHLELISDPGEVAPSPYAGPVQVDRLNSFESAVFLLLSEASKYPAEPVSGIVNEVIALLDQGHHFSGLSNDLSSTVLNALKADIGRRIETLRSVDETEQEIMACALNISLDVYRAIHRLGAAPVVSKMGLDRDGSSSTHRVRWELLAHSTLRFGLWVMSAGTTFLGVRGFGSWIFSQHLPSVPLSVAQPIQNMAALVAAVGVSETIRVWKRNVEQAGCYDKRTNVFSAILSATRKTPLLFVGLSAVVFFDVTTNIQGIGGFLLTEADTSQQIADIRRQSETGRKAMAEALQAQIDGAEVRRDAAVAANKALLHEAKGTYSQEPGLGPRWYGLASAYFGDQKFDTLKTLSAIGEISVPQGAYSIRESDWTVTQLDVDSWFAWGEVTYISDDIANLGWVLGPAATGRTPYDRVRSSINFDPDYVTVLEQLNIFRQGAPGVAYLDLIDQVWNAALAELLTISNDRFDQVDARIAAWTLDGDPLEMKREVLNDFQALVDDIKIQQAPVAQAAQDEMTAINERYAKFNYDLLEALKDEGTVVAQIPPPNAPQIVLPDPQFDASVFDGARNVLQMFKKSVERDPTNLPLGMMVFALAILVSYFDLLVFYVSVYKAYWRDREELDDELKKLANRVQDLLQVIHDHTNRGPMGSLYRPPSADPVLASKQGDALPYSHMKFRLREVLAAMVHAQRSPLVESGGVVNAAMALRPRNAPGRSYMNRLWELDISAYGKAILGWSSTASRACERLEEAIRHMLRDPRLLEDHILSGGRESRHPRDILHDVLDHPDHNYSTGNAKLVFRNELIRNVASISSQIKEAERDDPHVRAVVLSGIGLLKKVERKGKPLTGEDLFAFQEFLAEVDRLVRVAESHPSGGAYQEVLDLHTKLEKAKTEKAVGFGEALRASAALQRRAEEAAHQEREFLVYESQFQLVQALIDELSSRGNGSFSASRLNPEDQDRRVKEYDQWISGLQTQIDRLKKMMIQAPAVQRKRDELIDLCELRLAELRRERLVEAKEGEVKTRGRTGIFMKFWRHVNVLPEDSISVDQAYKFFEHFAQMHRGLYEGEPFYAPVKVTQDDIDFDGLVRAFGDLQRDLNETFDYGSSNSLGLNSSFVRYKSPLRLIGSVLKKALDAYGVDLGFIPPQPRKALTTNRQLTSQ